jgi:hypothetical protein
MYEILATTGSGVALFLFGANVSFIANLGTRLARWFLLKVSAITLLLLYVSLSMYVGQPDTWRIFLGFAALLLDVAALVWMWSSIEAMAKSGIRGYVPLFRDDLTD